jgi:hypothetical protein
MRITEEGKLVEISRILVGVDSGVSTTFKLEKNGERAEYDFGGLILPECIGHEVAYTDEFFPGSRVQKVLDKETNRTYMAICRGS